MARKTIPGIHVGGGFVHVPGTPWPDDKWEAFKEWAHQNGATIGDLGNSCRWETDGGYHREDGPAILTYKGYMAWRQNNQFHRVDGPSIVLPSGFQAWFQDGKRHRLDGPARILPSGDEEWLKDGVQYTDGTFTIRVVWDNHLQTYVYWKDGVRYVYRVSSDSD